MGEPETVWCRRCEKRSALMSSELCEPCVQYEQLLHEDVTACPAFLSQEDFERFMRKLSVHAFELRPPDARHMSLEHMERHLKEAVLEALPRYYVSMLAFSPQKQRQTKATGTYNFKAQLPQTILYGIIEKLGLWKKLETDDDPGYSAS